MGLWMDGMSGVGATAVTQCSRAKSKVRKRLRNLLGHLVISEIGNHFPMYLRRKLRSVAYQVVN